MSKASLAQGKQLLDVLSGATSTEIQRLIGAGDLLKMMMGANLDKVDRQAFEALLARPDLGLDKFGHLLLSLEIQLKRLRYYNRHFWGNSLSEEQFVAAGQLEAYIDWETAIDPHLQSIDSLDIFYVDFGSPEKTVEMWWKTLLGTQPHAWQSGVTERLRLNPKAKFYAPGIHLVRINMVSHWDPNDPQSSLEKRDRAISSGETLAAGEVLAACGLHDELMRRMDGVTLPDVVITGYEDTFYDDLPRGKVLKLYWDRRLHQVGLKVDWISSVNNSAVPVLQGS